MSGAVVVATDEPTILIAEDDRFDQLILRRAFKAAQIAAAIHFVEHGEKLLAFLRTYGPEPAASSAPLPSIIFLDLNMPMTDGWEALTRIRAEPAWAHLPIVVMSTLTDQREIDRVLAMGANHYFTKPVHFNELVDTIRVCAKPWLMPHGA
jgi:CheY-like chemotaxis protein